ncbi:cell wall hydrolase [Novosphingobium fluoreni]|uniref:cell wall hydrolase n=1 Tax=Novosphingobium fluoreni TaxID=1391222 RepID=UPI000735E1D8|nr:hydrolase [Novosphingobium barchaimii]
MLRKVRLASAVALAGTLITGLFTVKAAGAAAEAMIPTLVSPTASTEFISRPIIQALPQAGTEAEEGDNLAAAHAGSLDALVDAQPTGQNLSDEMRCLAGAIYFEARGESLEGQLAVGRVVVNRSKSGRFPSSYCGVVYQPSQFSFVRGRSMPAVRTSSSDWHEAVAVARIADQGMWRSEATGALYFHAARVSPSWRLTRLARVDNHIFYR